MLWTIDTYIFITKVLEAVKVDFPHIASIDCSLHDVGGLRIKITAVTGWSCPYKQFCFARTKLKLPQFCCNELIHT